MYSRRKFLVAIGALSILPGIALAQQVDKNKKWYDLIERGLERNLLVIDPKSKSETFLAPQKVDKRFSWNHNMSRVLIFNMRNASIRSYIRDEGGPVDIDNRGVITDLYIPPVYYHEFVNRLKETRGLSRIFNVKFNGDDVSFLGIKLHPLAALDSVPQKIYDKVNLDRVKKGRFVIGLSKGLPENDEQYVIIGAI
jgi:hypothetical protein